MSRSHFERQGRDSMQQHSHVFGLHSGARGVFQTPLETKESNRWRGPGTGASYATQPHGKPELPTTGDAASKQPVSGATADGNAVGSNGAPQKKSSRACDHCRLKKLKCNTEPGEVKCTNCHGRECEYTRQPLKRGPPKGRKLKRKATEVDNESDGDASPDHDGANGKHRMTKGDGRFDPIRDAEEAILNDASLDPQFRQAPVVMPAPLTVPSRPGRRESWHAGREHALPPLPPSLQLEALPIYVEYNQAAVEKWYLLHQTTLPILGRDTDELPAYLTQTHPLLRSALLLAIYSVVDRSRTPQRIDALLAERFLLQYTATKTRESTHDRIVHIQVSLVLAIEADQRGMQKMPGRCGHSFTHWLATSISLAVDLRVHSINAIKQTSDEYWRLRRLYFIMVIMDRWHAFGHAHPLMIPDLQIPFSPTVDLLGPAAMHLYNMSMLIGKVHGRMSRHTFLRDLPELALLTTTEFQEVQEELNAFREAVEPIWGQSNLLHIGLWHVALVAGLSSEQIDVDFIKDHAMRVSAVLPHSATPFTTLNHHFFAMSALSLFYVLGFHEHEDFAIKHLEQLREAIVKHKHLALDDDEANWDAQLLYSINAMLDGHPEATPFVTAASGNPMELLSEIRSSGYMRAW